MPNYITIDGGTTNTRIKLVIENKCVDLRKLNIGAKNGIDNRKALIQAIRQGIDEILKTNNIPESKIKIILASGMITSELGLINLPHISAPASIADLHNNLCETIIEEISSIPFAFVPGVKCNVDNFENCDMMRGEETEFIGIYRGEGVYLLPGSHSKVIIADDEQRIVEFNTMLTGEMIAALSQNTILKNSIDLKDSELDNNFILKGYEFCKQNGVNSSLFKVRILDKIFTRSKSEVYSFFIGVVLCDEIEQILKKNPKRIVIGGQSKIKRATAAILKEVSLAKVEIIEDLEAEQATNNGIIKIYEYSNNEG